MSNDDHTPQEDNETTLDTLARMIGTMAGTLDTFITTVNNRFDALEQDLSDFKIETSANFRLVRDDIADLKHDRVSRLEFEDLMARMKLVERTLHIDSGK